MPLVQTVHSEQFDHPLDAIEGIAQVNDWDYERCDDDEVVVEANGAHAGYSIAFNWMEPLHSLHMAASFPFKPPEHRRHEIEKLLIAINEQLWIGHFDAWKGEGVILFRHCHLIGASFDLEHDVAQSLLSSAIDTCDQFYAAFHHVGWSDCSAEKALQSVLFETIGEA